MIAFRQHLIIPASILAIALLAIIAGTESLAASAAPVANTPDPEGLQAELTLQYDHDTAESRFYEARGFKPVWLDSDGAATPAAQALLSWVGQADTNALPASRYNVSGLAARLASTGADNDAGELEIRLTRLFLTYARDISSGLLEPWSISRNIDIETRRPDPAALLAGIGTSNDIPAFLDGLIPADPAYDRLLSLYAEMRNIERNGGWGPQIAKGHTLRSGDRDPRVEQLRTRLIAMGDLAPVQQFATSNVMNDSTPPPIDPLIFDSALDAAVRRFQNRHGLNEDGIIGTMTLGALNTTAAERAVQIAVNLERRRWMNYDLGARHILINTAAFKMTVYEDGAPQFSTRTIVGKARKHQTPEFNDILEFMVVNPYWNVPYSIASEEILPELQKDPTYLEQNNMELTGTDLPASEIDWSQVTRRSFPGRIRQRPGPDNALGAVKFLFPNDHAIYMHDTPSRNLFAYDQRTFSHGCIRLQDPFGFAHLLMSLQTDNPVGFFDRMRALGDEKWIRVKEPIPVYVIYRTAWLGNDSIRQFRADVYRRDRDVMAALTAAGVLINGG